jgi:hypothetical protein
MKRREYKQRAWRAVKAFVADEGYESIMDDLTVECSELQWQELLSWIEVAREVLKSPDVAESARPLCRLFVGRLKVGIVDYDYTEETRWAS